MIVSKKDLRFIHYKWYAEGDPLHVPLNGTPSRRYFDSYNGNQVLFLINLYATTSPSFKPVDVLLLESMLAHKLPAEIKSEKSVYAWMIQMSNPAK